MKFDELKIGMQVILKDNNFGIHYAKITNIEIEEIIDNIAFLTCIIDDNNFEIEFEFCISDFNIENDGAFYCLEGYYAKECEYQLFFTKEKLIKQLHLDLELAVNIENKIKETIKNLIILQNEI